jgi:5'-nucleotidase
VNFAHVLPQSNRPKRFVGALVISLSLLGGAALVAPVQATEVKALPGAPATVTATAVPGGIQVSWTPPTSSGNLPIVSYSITGGPGTCAVTVPGTATAAFVPNVPGQPGNIFHVTATNSLGNGPEKAAIGIIDPVQAIGARVLTANGTTTIVGAGEEIAIASKSVTAAVSTRDGRGIWSVNSAGRLTASGAATPISGQLAGTVAILPSWDDRGVTLVSRNGTVKSFGTAKINARVSAGSAVVGAAPTKDGKGIWVVRANGVIDSVGSAGKAKRLPGPIAAVTFNTDRTGGWAARTNGQVVAFGAAPAIKGARADKPVSMWHTTGNGVWVLNRDGSISSFGDAVTTYDRVKNGRVIVGAAADMKIKAVNVNYFSDFHGQIEASSGIGGAATLASYFNNDRVLGTTFVASAGDNIGAAPPISNEFEEIPTILGLNGMGLDVSVFGNHEHDRNLAHLNKMLDLSKFQWIASNYSSLAELPKARSFTIIERDGVKVGFVGANTTETVEVTFPGNLGNIVIQDPIKGVNAAIVEARKAGAEIVVALLHYGYAENQGDQPVGALIDITKALKGADIVFGGHSHLTWSGRVNGTLVQQVVNAGQRYARTQVCLDQASGSKIGSGGQFVTPLGNRVTPDAALTAMVKGYSDQLVAKFDSKIGTVNGVFPFGGNPAVQRQGEVAIGNFLADTLKAKYATDLVVINGGGIRAAIPALNYVPKTAGLVRPTSASSTGVFDIVLGDIYTVLPFGNQVATTSLSGAQLWAALENGVSQVETNGGRFPQISGFKFTFDASKPAGSRVESVFLNNGTAIAKDSKEYTLTTLDFMISGGDGYTTFNPTKAIIRDLYAQVVVDAIVAKGAITIPALDGRIVRK